MVETHGRYRFVFADDETKVVPAYAPSTSEVIVNHSTLFLLSLLPVHIRAEQSLPAEGFRAVIGARKNDTRK